jgi:hypothetical protein
MRLRGVHYDAGTAFRGPGFAIPTRRKPLDMAVVQREVQIIRDDLHANAVRVVGSDLARLTAVARIVLDAGLEVWFSPAIFEYPPEETQSRLVAAAAAAAPLERGHPGRVVFVAGSEHTLLTRGLLPGRSVVTRLKHLKAEPALLRNGKLNRLRNRRLGWRASFRGCAPLSPGPSPMRR